MGRLDRRDSAAIALLTGTAGLTSVLGLAFGPLVAAGVLSGLLIAWGARALL